MNEALTRQFLHWLETGPRSYSDIMEAWKTSCPRLSIWEDAQANGWVEVKRSALGTEVWLSDQGRAWLRAGEAG